MIFEERYYNKVKKLADFVASAWDPKMKWMWGEALLGYALDELDKEDGTENYTAFLKAYCDYWVKADPAVDQRHVSADLYHISHRVDRRSGGAAWPSEKTAVACPRAFYDDVYRFAVYSYTD